MIGDILFTLAQLSLFLLGSGAAFHPSVRTFSVAARLAVALAAGAVALTIEATLLSLFGIRWSIGTIAAPLLLASGLLTARWARQTSPSDESRFSHRRLDVFALCLWLLAFAYLILSLAASASTSVDYLLFWGVKAVRFAEARGIDAAFLRNVYSYHAVPNYPPLAPVVHAWGALAAGRMPWRLAPVLSAMWPIAASAIIFEFLRRQIAAGAAAVTAFWSVALSFSLAYSYSGGNAEAPLLFFETVALASLLAEPENGKTSRFLPGVALCGAALTKVEGTVAALTLVGATLWRDRLLRRPGALGGALRLSIGPALGLAVWFAYQRSAGLPVGFRPHGELLRLYPAHFGSIARQMSYFLCAGTSWLSWAVPALLLIAFANRCWRQVLPALALAFGILGFLAFDYLHDANDPATRIGWTMPRVSQPALSALIVAAGLASMRGLQRDELT